MLIELTTLAHIPCAHCIVETAREYAHTIGRYVNAAGAVRVALKLFDKQVIVDVPHGNVAVRAAAKADLGIGRNGECVASGRL